MMLKLATILIILSTAIDAYSFNGLPIAKLIFIVLQFYCVIGIINHKKNLILIDYNFITYTLISVLVLLYYVLLGNYEFNYLEKNKLFIPSRFLNYFLSLSLLIYLYSTIKTKDQIFEIFNTIINCSLIIAVISFYIYFAHLYDLPEITRSRIGTNGGEQLTKLYYYKYHRALGPFREPGLLAGWAITGFYISMIKTESKNIFISIMLGILLWMTGSILIIIGYFISLLILVLINSKNYNFFIKGIIIFIISGLISGFIIQDYSEINFVKFKLFDFLIYRKELVDYGLHIAPTPEYYSTEIIKENSSFYKDINLLIIFLQKIPGRGDIVAFLLATPIKIFGYGSGFSNLLLYKFLVGDANMPASFLNIIVCTLYSSGIFATYFLVAFLIKPIIVLFRNNKYNNYVYFIGGAYIVQLWLYLFLYEEFNPMFILVYTLLYKFYKNEKNNLCS